MIKLRKLLLVMLMMFMLFFVTSTSIKAATSAVYIKSSSLENNSLEYGITHSIDAGTSHRSGSSTFNSQVVNILQIPSDATYKVTSWMNYSGNKWNKTTVTRMMRNFESENPGWMAIAGINGDFFDINGTGNFPYQSGGATASGGNFYKSTPHRSYYSVGFTNNGEANSLIAAVKPSRTENMILAVYDENDQIVFEYQVENLNSVPSDNASAVYFGTYDSSQTYQSIDVPTVSDGSVYLVGEAEVSLPNSKSDYYGLGTITDTTVSTLKEGQFAIVTKNPEIQNALSIGKKIRIQYQWAGDFANVGDIISAGTAVLLNSDVPSDANTADGSRMNAAHPRTAIGRKADGTIVMAVVDGRQETIGRYGVYGDELGVIMREYGCVDAYNLDGGGSSTMVIRQNGQFVVKNSPSDSSERADSNCIIVAVKIPTFTYETVSTTNSSVTLKVNFSDYASMNPDNIYFTVNNKSFKVEDELVTIEGVQSNQYFTASLGYYNPFNNYVRTYVSTSIYCPPLKYVLRSLTMSSDESSFSFELRFTDRDKTTNLSKCKIIVNDHEVDLVDGKATVAKALVGEFIYSTVLKFEETILDNTSTVMVYNLHSKVTYVFYEFHNSRQEALNG